MPAAVSNDHGKRQMTDVYDEEFDDEFDALMIALENGTATVEQQRRAAQLLVELAQEPDE